MKNEVHVLNGDALFSRFPKEITGQRIICRECLIEGPLNSTSEEEFYTLRAQYLKNSYPEVTQEDYQQKTVAEFEKIKELTANSEIYLWFEHDLFCQSNLWFILDMINQLDVKQSIFLVEPSAPHVYSFGHLSDQELISCYENKRKLDLTSGWFSLWKYYQTNDLDALKKTAEQLTEYPFVLAAVQAHIDRYPKNGTLGRPKESLLKIMQEIGTNEFSKVFPIFWEREAIYGFGDLQVARMLNELDQ